MLTATVAAAELASETGRPPVACTLWRCTLLAKPPNLRRRSRFTATAAAATTATTMHTPIAKPADEPEVVVLEAVGAGNTVTCAGTATIPDPPVRSDGTKPAEEAAAAEKRACMSATANARAACSCIAAVTAAAASSGASASASTASSKPAEAKLAEEIASAASRRAATLLPEHRTRRDATNALASRVELRMRLATPEATAEQTAVTVAPAAADAQSTFVPLLLALVPSLLHGQDSRNETEPCTTARLRGVVVPVALLDIDGLRDTAAAEGKAGDEEGPALAALLPVAEAVEVADTVAFAVAVAVVVTLLEPEAAAEPVDVTVPVAVPLVVAVTEAEDIAVAELEGDDVGTGVTDGSDGINSGWFR